MTKTVKNLAMGTIAALALAGCGDQGGLMAGMGDFMKVRPSGPVAAGQAATGSTAITDPFANQPKNVPDYAKAPSTAGASTTRSTSQTHTVTAGETAWSVARRYGISVADLAAANNLSGAMGLRVGQTLTIPAGGKAATLDTTSAPGQGSASPLPPSAAKPLPDEKTDPASAPVARPDAPDLGKTRTKASGSGKFRLPADGAIVRAYSKGKNDGIDISAGAGASVKAAASGTVAAITTDTEGTPIVVIRHDNGLMTVYAGLDGLSVSKGDKVKSGQSIGKARGKGVVHFEVRKGFEAVDPEKYI